MASLKKNEKDQCQTIVDNCEGPLGPRIGDCKVITIESLDSRSDETERNPKPSKEVEIEKVKLFEDHDV